MIRRSTHKKCSKFGVIFFLGNEALLQKMSKLHSLEVHRGCVNSIWWDETGQYLLSGSDDHRLVITEPYSKKVFVDVYTSHKANIFSAKFLPCSNTRKIVSCAGDGNILYTGKICRYFHKMLEYLTSLKEFLKIVCNETYISF